MFDLNGNGQIDLTAADTVYYDVDGDAFAESVSWVAATDGFLVRDINENGAIDGIAEMFGNDTVDGFTALATHDGNVDGVIDASDAIWSDLRLWRDLNQDGYSQAGELFALGDFDITAISLTAAATSANPLITHDGTAQTGTGTIRVSNILFDADQVNTRYSGEYTLDIATLFLPTLRGYGQVADLHIAASIDDSTDANGDTILDKLTALASYSLTDLAANMDAVRENIDTLIFHWAGVEGTPDYARGIHMQDARPLIFLEKYLNEAFNDSFLGDQSIGVMQSGYIITAFGEARDKFLGALVFQAAGRQLFDSAVHYDIAKDVITGANGIALSQDMLDDLSDYAAGLAGTAERSAFWKSIADLLWQVNKAIDPQFESTVDNFGLSAAEEAKLDAAISASDAVLTWYAEDHGVGGLLSVEYAYGQISGLNIVGDGLDETLTGSILDDYIWGAGGVDTIDGDEGDDRLIGHVGNDIIHGGAGDDNIEGDYITNYNPGNDTLYGEDGNDYIGGGRGEDTIYGGAGNDEIWGDMNPGTAQDYYYATGEDDYLDGGLGSDYINAGGGNDILVDGYDSTGQDLLIGGAGDDIYRLMGGGGEVYIQQGEGAGSDTIELPSVFVDESELQFERILDNLHITGSKGGYAVDIYIIDQCAGYAWLRNLKFQAGTPNEYVFDLVGVHPGLLAYGSQGDDLIFSIDGSTNNTYSDTIHGLGGNDRIYGSFGDDYLYGDDGNDTLYGEWGADELYGGNGDDALIEMQNEGAVSLLDGGAGDDTYFASNTSIYVASDDNDTITNNQGGTIEFQNGVVLADLTFERANIHDIVIHHPTGTMTIKDYFKGGHYYVLSFSDSSTVTLTSRIQQLTTNGTSGDDVLKGVDSVWGNDDDIIYGHDGNDEINAYNGNNQLYGGAGNDIITGGSGGDYIDGGEGDDKMYGGNGVNTYVAYGNDYIVGGSGDDTLIMPEGITEDDIVMYREFYSQYGKDTLSIEIASLNMKISVRQFADQNNVRSESIVFSDNTSITNLSSLQYVTRGTANNDIMDGIVLGGSVDDIMYGYEGNDTLRGWQGNDYLDGGIGDSYLDGGEGNDTFVYNGYATSIVASSGNDTLLINDGSDVTDFTLSAAVYNGYDGLRLYNTATSTEIRILYGSGYDSPLENIHFQNGLKLKMYMPNYWHFGTTADETITATNAAMTIIANAGNDIVYAQGYNDQIDGGLGSDVLYGGGGNDYLFDASGADALYGQDGNDNLHGGGTDGDLLDGGSGNDNLYGGQGSDQLYGQDGLDHLWGGGGADGFHFTAASAFNNIDVIHDFSVAEGDAIDLSDLLSAYDPLTDAIEDFVRITDNGTDSALAVDVDGGGDSFVQIATLAGVTGLTDEALLQTQGALLT